LKYFISIPPPPNPRNEKEAPRSFAVNGGLYLKRIFLHWLSFSEILLISLFSVHDQYFVCKMAFEFLTAQLGITKQNFSTLALSESEMELTVGKE